MDTNNENVHASGGSKSAIEVFNYSLLHYYVLLFLISNSELISSKAKKNSNFISL